MTIPEMIGVLEAAEKGELIEYRQRGRSDCSWCSDEPPSWNFGTHDYRVAPKLFEGWVNVTQHTIEQRACAVVYPTELQAKRAACTLDIRCVHVREVT